MVAEVPEPSQDEQDRALLKVVGKITGHDETRFGLSPDERDALTHWYFVTKRRIYPESQKIHEAK